MSEASPPPLLPRIASGDPAAVQECMARYKSLVWWLARRQAGTDAEDAVQDIFIELWKNADPELQPRVEDARRRIAELVAEPR